MWHNPQQLNLVSRALFGVSLLLVLYAALHYLVHLPTFALRAVQLESAPIKVEASQVEAVIQTELRGNYFTADLEHMRQKLETLPWVRSAHVRRYLPWELEVSLEEHVALARWNNTALVNQQGEVFEAEINSKHADERLPDFSGPPDSAAEVTQMYFEFERHVAALQAEHQGHKIAQVVLSPRRAWQLRFDNGMLLDLGREEMLPRLTRFVEAYPHSIASVKAAVNYVDLRYRNGFAVNLSGGNILGGNIPSANFYGRSTSGESATAKVERMKNL